jgi:methyl-accepting chemotaxis protein
VQEQGDATTEIARNVHEIAQAAQEVTSTIAGVSQAAGKTGDGATKVLTEAGELCQQSDRLSSRVHTFVARVRAA